LPNPNSDYCGFMCGPVLDDVQKILDEVKTLSKYNPEFAVEFLDKIIDKVNETKEVVKTGT
jgi:hypothetical protein